MTPPLKQLGSLSTSEFLRDYWQQKPLLVRNAFPEFKTAPSSILTPDELAGLALEEDVESRIIIENSNDGPWQMLQGPFEENTFSQLPETHWTLLVQAVDQWIPEAKELLDQFRFLPSWRLDDLMVSYAPEGGSVGPHFDYYDVFLIQGHGKRRWQIGPKCDDDSPRVAGTPLRILQQFKVEHEWVLDPGDMLYLPPQYSHNGVAVDDCLTYSVGFRAPSISEIIDDLATDAISHHREHQRYADPRRAGADKSQYSSGEISPEDIKPLQAILTKALLDEDLLRNWLGRYMTDRKYPELDISNGESSDWEVALRQGDILERHPASRFAYTQLDENNAELFVDGEAVKTSLSLAKCLCSNTPLGLPEIEPHLNNPAAKDVIEQLIEYGALVLESPD